MFKPHQNRRNITRLCSFALLPISRLYFDLFLGALQGRTLGMLPVCCRHSTKVNKATQMFKCFAFQKREISKLHSFVLFITFDISLPARTSYLSYFLHQRILKSEKLTRKSGQQNYVKYYFRDMCCNQTSCVEIRVGHAYAKYAKYADYAHMRNMRMRMRIENLIHIFQKNQSF